MSSKVGVRISIPYLHGAYLGLNAVSDAYFLGDGPNCLFDKAAHIHGRHDLFSTLLSCEGAHRVQHSGVNVFNIAGDTEKGLAADLRRVAAQPGCGAVFLGSMPMCSIVGTDYERILREALGAAARPAFVMPRRTSIAGDWLVGYADFLETMAKGMDLSGARPEKDAVAVVGYFMDRNEGDHHGNLRELRRLFGALGLDPVSIWLSGGSYESLREVRRASAIVSLPYGRRAAAELARRLALPLIELELPFGLEASRRFLSGLGRALGREGPAEELARRELDRVVPRLQWTVPHAFLGRRFAFTGDPHAARAFIELIEGLGGRLTAAVVLGNPAHLDEAARGELLARPEVAFQPVTADVSKRWDEIADENRDVVVGSSFPFEHLRRGSRWLEFGYPSEATHFLREEPFLFFEGALAFLSRLANEVTRGLEPEGHGD